MAQSRSLILRRRIEMLNIESKNNLPANFKDPFKESKVACLHIHFYQGTGVNPWSSSIEFKNGNTEGKQKFEGNNLADLVNEMTEFVKKL